MDNYNNRMQLYVMALWLCFVATLCGGWLHVPVLYYIGLAGMLSFAFFACVDSILALVIGDY
jgi:hypothetical protein